MILSKFAKMAMGVIFIATLGCATAGPPAGGIPEGEWHSFGRDRASSKYSPLDQINPDNIDQLEIAWRWDSVENELPKKNKKLFATANECTPLMIGGRLYVITAFSQVAAIDAGTGETIWSYDPESWKAGRPTNLGYLQRGVSYWTDGEIERIYFPTGDAHLISLDARTGKPDPAFGDGGRIDLTEGMSRPVNRRVYTVNSPPIICRDVVVIGSAIFDGPTRKEMPPGDVRGFDARTGEVRWTFVSVPQEGDFGSDTWEEDSWKYTGNTNVWTLMSADEELGYVYLPFGTPTNDWYGGHRKGDDLFAESIVCVDVETGERVWHYQTVHHGVWDYDLPAAPNLIDIEVDGRAIKALAQITKTGFTFVLDRTTGEPVWPIEERPVPASKAEGEMLSKTQPHPTRPAPFDRQGIHEDELIDFTPELRAEALELVSRYEHGDIFTPPTEHGTIYVPGWGGGSNWGGAAYDPETDMLYVPSVTGPILMTLRRPDAARSNFTFVGQVSMGLRLENGLPILKPPFGRITAIDLSTGDFAWQVPHGDGPRDHEALKGLDLPPLGNAARGYPAITKTLLLMGQEARGGRGGGASQPSLLRAFDKANGEVIWEKDLGGSITACPMTYMHEGKQYIAIAIGGGRTKAEVVALALP